ncbi:aggregation-promoting factor C-terminal-like domain-containing protein [Micromonospora zhanjiangensis]|uniref:Peptidoglycan-binding protein n=1 Tax=Micromonospora zhanjiangensis TaxID=1522057 RepID=A0ABV8KU94_9ACTN
MQSLLRRPGTVARLLAVLVTVTLAGLVSSTPAQAVDSTTTLQKNLVGIGYLATSGVDGQYGPQTTAAVKSFQHDNGLAEDGDYGSRTELALHNKIKEVQRVAGVSADGAYGPNTTAAVRSYQSGHGLTADGIAGGNTMSKMGVARTVWITAQNKIVQHGWTVSAQFNCLNQLWIHESNWKVYATNPSSGAYGIPQSLPGSKMGAAGSDWQTNPATQIEWGEDYIKSRYGTPCAAWSFWQAQSPHWY